MGLVPGSSDLSTPTVSTDGSMKAVLFSSYSQTMEGGQDLDKAVLREMQTWETQDENARPRQLELEKTTNDYLAESRNILFRTETCSSTSEQRITIGPRIASDDANQMTHLKPTEFDKFEYKSEQGCRASLLRPFRGLIGWCMAFGDKPTVTYIVSRDSAVPLSTYVDTAKAKALGIPAGDPLKDKPDELFQLMLSPYAAMSDPRMGEVGRSVYHKEGALHTIVMSLLKGLQFLHEVKGIAVLDFAPASILVSKDQSKPLITKWDNACFFTINSPFPCVPAVVPPDTDNVIYEPLAYYGYDAISPTYAEWWKPDIFLLAVQLVLPLLTGGQVTAQTICRPPTPARPDSAPQVASMYSLDKNHGAVTSEKNCAPFINAIFGYFEKPDSWACNSGVRKLSNWMVWHPKAESTTDPNAGAWLLSSAALKNRYNQVEKPAVLVRRMLAYKSLFVKLAKLHNADSKDQMMCPRYDQQSDQDVVALQRPSPSQTAPTSLFAMLSDPRYRFIGLNGLPLASENEAPCLNRNRRVLACKWISFLLDALQCHEIRPSASELAERLATHYKTNSWFSDPDGCFAAGTDVCDLAGYRSLYDLASEHPYPANRGTRSFATMGPPPSGSGTQTFDYTRGCYLYQNTVGLTAADSAPTDVTELPEIVPKLAALTCPVGQRPVMSRADSGLTASCGEEPNSGTIVQPELGPAVPTEEPLPDFDVPTLEDIAAE